MGLGRAAFWQRDDPISIHPSRVGWDHKGALVWPRDAEFQSTHPVWDGTTLRAAHVTPGQHFNPPIPCGMGQLLDRGLMVGEGISIHPSRVGWDQNIHDSKISCCHFNPPIPCGMGRRRRFSSGLLRYFNPPIPCGMGPERRSSSSQNRYFNPPIPCGMGLHITIASSLSL